MGEVPSRLSFWCLTKQKITTETSIRKHRSYTGRSINFMYNTNRLQQFVIRKNLKFLIARPNFLPPERLKRAKNSWRFWLTYLKCLLKLSTIWLAVVSSRTFQEPAASPTSTTPCPCPRSGTAGCSSSAPTPKRGNQSSARALGTPGTWSSSWFVTADKTHFGPLSLNPAFWIKVNRTFSGVFSCFVKVWRSKSVKFQQAGLRFYLNKDLF